MLQNISIKNTIINKTKTKKKKLLEIRDIWSLCKIVKENAMKEPATTEKVKIGIDSFKSNINEIKKTNILHCRNNSKIQLEHGRLQDI